jgi:HAD superfamily hydrolase (TIGR01459 family)
MRIEGLVEIASQFDAMLIDQFGVIHDGQKLYPGALEVIQELKRIGVPVVVMTNSGKRAAPNATRIVNMGIPRELFVDCVSSGEVAWQSLQVSRAFLIGKRGEDYGFDPVQFVDAADAEIMLILGSNAPETSLEDYRRMFAGVTLPALCCNPDKLMITSKGLQPAPGAIAEVYESMGGKVTWVGKPYGGIYEHALKLLDQDASFRRTRESRLSTYELAESLDSRVRRNDGVREGAKRILCIGDSAEHDVAGGRSAGLSTLLVMQGVSHGANPEEIHPYPDYLMASFRWPSSP